MARGGVVEQPLASVVAYCDWERFGVLPRAGGTFDQDDDMLREMRYIGEVVSTARRAEHDRQHRELERARRRP